ncbi:orotate phosphoribosyltransferase [candidate division NPL-UPA2 bacterium]|nr:orotate phosphoribosyltransferase [candidate division NPL-UPA2 bacterium]
MSEKEVLSILREAEALLKGHFKLSSGLHSSQYVQCALVLSFPHYAERLAESLAEPFKEEKIALVIGPAMGGIILSQEVGRALRARAIFAERPVCRAEHGTGREEEILSLRRGFKIQERERVLVVEDVITTGRSVKKVMEIVREEGGTVRGVASLIDRSLGKVDFGVRWETLISLDLKAYLPDQCPLCKEGIPLEKLGSG